MKIYIDPLDKVCQEALRLLEEKRIICTVVDVRALCGVRERLSRETGSSDLPQVFDGTQYLGGIGIIKKLAEQCPLADEQDW